jgi:hypothetical protein
MGLLFAYDKVKVILNGSAESTFQVDNSNVLPIFNSSERGLATISNIQSHLKVLF